MDISVEDVPGEERYEARSADGALAGYAAYQLASNLIVMTHTEVDPAFEGQGVATALIRGALDDIRERRIPMLPLCPFVVAFLQRHPDYADLVYTPPTLAGSD